jgi:hypothetical protein
MVICKSNLNVWLFSKVNIPKNRPGSSEQGGNNKSVSNDTIEVNTGSGIKYIISAPPAREKEKL